MRLCTAFFGVLMMSCIGLLPVANAQSDHGVNTVLGTLKVAEMEFSITRFGEVVAGKEAAFAVELTSGDKNAISQLNLYLWVEDESGTQLSAPAKGTPEGNGLHFHLTPRAGSVEPKKVTLRVRKDGKDERASLPLDGHGHEHAKAPHDGMIGVLKDKDGAQVGFIELKLHDDKGDLEAWLAKDKDIKEPLDVPLATAIKVNFIDLSGKSATLSVRNSETNEDEDGKANIRNAKTNYFVFPGASGQDAAWLQGKTFQSIVEVAFDADGKSYKSEEFVLSPHTHEGGHAH